jgi:hypothetical protein
MARLAKCGPHQSPEEVFEQPHQPTVPHYEPAPSLQSAKNPLYDEGQAICNLIFYRRISQERREGTA